METVHVNLGPRSYDIAIGGAIEEIVPFVNQFTPRRSRSALLVYDTNSQQHAGLIEYWLDTEVFEVECIAVPAGEASKGPEQLQRIYDALVDMCADRRTLVVAIGGGVIGDLAGFAAATFNRGLPLLMVPTTLLAMVDSSVGGKTGINHTKGKNLIGAFHQPAGVWIDPAMLGTLPDREFKSGLAEVVKYGVILDAEFFAWLEANTAAILKRDPAALTHVIATSCKLKAKVVEQDERETTGLRAVLNYGHTFAHAFETAANYGGLLHGEAVSIGMDCAAKLALRLGRIDIVQRQRTLLEQFDLPVTVNPAWPIDDLLSTMKRDKKTEAGRLRFVLPIRLGEVELVDGVDEALVREVLRS